MKGQYRDRSLLELASGQHCLVRVPDICNSRPDTVVAAHSNQLRHGKGRGLKADDCYSVWACSACHAWIDQGGGSGAERIAAWEAAFWRQKQEWRLIADSVTLKPKRVNAARKVLAYLEEK